MSSHPTRARRALSPLALLLAVALGTPAGPVFADATQDEIAALRAQLQQITERLDQLSRQAAGNGTALAPAAGSAVAGNSGPAPIGAAGASGSMMGATGPAHAAASGTEPMLEALLRGFYGNLDVSIDDTSKGIDGLVAYPWQLNNPTNPGSGFSVAGGPKAPPVGRVGYMPALSSNKSSLGYRGTHAIAGSAGTSLVYQIEASLSLTAAPGLNTSYTAQGNTVKGTLGSGDTYLGLANPTFGQLKVGTTYTPYKKSTDRLNPFSGMLGDYAVIMGNSGGDNRVEFGTRQDHAIWYESPRFLDQRLALDFLWSPGQNRTYDNVVQSAGSADCNGGNAPGSGNLPLNCDDGGFSNALSVALRYEDGPVFGTVAYEQHQNVNRNSDGIGSNNPLYGVFASQYPNLVVSPTNNPQGLPASALGGYVDDIGTASILP